MDTFVFFKLIQSFLPIGHKHINEFDYSISVI